jgi:hypothetical protein
MKSFKIIGLAVLCIFIFTGCAGMNARQQSDIGTNAAVGGGIGAIAAGTIAAVTHGNPVAAAVLGGLGGALLGVASTPSLYNNVAAPNAPAVVYVPVVPAPPYPGYYDYYSVHYYEWRNHIEWCDRHPGDKKCGGHRGH